MLGIIKTCGFCIAATTMLAMKVSVDTFAFQMWYRESRKYDVINAKFHLNKNKGKYIVYILPMSSTKIPRYLFFRCLYIIKPDFYIVILYNRFIQSKIRSLVAICRIKWRITYERKAKSVLNDQSVYEWQILLFTR